MRKRVSSGVSERSCGSGAGAALAMSLRIVGRFLLEKTPDLAARLVEILFFGVVGAFALAGAALFQALGEADGRADEIEFLPQLILQETLIAEMQRFKLVGEEHEGRRRRGGLSDVENLHFAAGGRGAAGQIDLREPTIQLASGNAPTARFYYTIDYFIEAIDVLASFRRQKNDGCVGQKFQAGTDQRLVVLEKLVAADVRDFCAAFILIH